MSGVALNTKVDHPANGATKEGTFTSYYTNVGTKLD
jgi:hypothetical protein